MGFLKLSLILVSHFDINSSFKCFLLCNHPLYFSNRLTFLRLSMTKSKISLGKCHIVLENKWVFFKYIFILLSHLNVFFSVITFCFFNLLTLLRFAMAKSKISLGKCHIALENMWVISNIF